MRLNVMKLEILTRNMFTSSRDGFCNRDNQHTYTEPIKKLPLCLSADIHKYEYQD